MDRGKVSDSDFELMSDNGTVVRALKSAKFLMEINQIVFFNLSSSSSSVSLSLRKICD